jgi:hypothetical protein
VYWPIELTLNKGPPRRVRAMALVWYVSATMQPTETSQIPVSVDVRFAVNDMQVPYLVHRYCEVTDGRQLTKVGFNPNIIL